MEIKNYLPRIGDALLAKKLRQSGAVLVTGPKWCGKTATSSVAAKSVVYMQDPDKAKGYMMAAVEVKLGHKQIEEAAENLKKLATKVDLEKMGKPSFLMVLTCGEFAYQREDGVLVVPIGCLKD